MTSIQSIIYGAIQGITEILPISSSGHLIIYNDFIGVEPSILSLTFLHLASALALLVLYSKNILKILKTKNFRIVFYIVGTAIPIAIAGVLFGDYIDNIFYKTFFIALNSIIWGIVMLGTQYLVKEKVEDLSFKKALIIGSAQVLALIPGTSRSGVTSLAGVWSGMSKTKILSFTFLMGIFLLLGTFSYEFLKQYKTVSISDFDFIAFISAFIFSLLAGLLLKKLAKGKFFLVFGIYRVLFGIILFIL